MYSFLIDDAAICMYFYYVLGLVDMKLLVKLACDPFTSLTESLYRGTSRIVYALKSYMYGEEADHDRVR